MKILRKMKHEIITLDGVQILPHPQWQVAEDTFV